MEREPALRFMHDLLRLMVARAGSDLFITAESPPAMKIDGRLARVAGQTLGPAHTAALARALMNERQADEFARTRECNFAIAPAGIGRFRVNAFVQQGKVGMVMRVIPNNLPTIDGLGVPQVLNNLGHATMSGSDVPRPTSDDAVTPTDKLFVRNNGLVPEMPADLKGRRFLNPSTKALNECRTYIYHKGRVVSVVSCAGLTITEHPAARAGAKYHA